MTDDVCLLWGFGAASDDHFGFLASPTDINQFLNCVQTEYVTIQNVYNIFDIDIILNTLCDSNLSKIIYKHCICVYVKLQRILLI